LFIIRNMSLLLFVFILLACVIGGVYWFINKPFIEYTEYTKRMLQPQQEHFLANMSKYVNTEAWIKSLNRSKMSTLMKFQKTLGDKPEKVYDDLTITIEKYTLSLRLLFLVIRHELSFHGFTVGDICKRINNLCFSIGGETIVIRDKTKRLVCWSHLLYHNETCRVMWFYKDPCYETKTNLWMLVVFLSVDHVFNLKKAEQTIKIIDLGPSSIEGLKKLKMECGFPEVAQADVAKYYE
jgi:hypothetical protein